MVFDVYFKKQPTKRLTSLEQKQTSQFLSRGRLLGWVTCFTPLLELQARRNLKISSPITCHRRWLRLLLQVKKLTAHKFKTCPAEDSTEALCIAQSQVTRMQHSSAGRCPSAALGWDVQRQAEAAVRLEMWLKDRMHHPPARWDGQRGSSGKQAGCLPPVLLC